MTSTDPPPSHKKAAYILLSLTMVLAVLAALFVHLSRHANYYATDPGHITKAQAHSVARELKEDDEVGRDVFQTRQMTLEDRYDTYTAITLAVAFAALSAGITCVFITKVDVRVTRVMTGLTVIFIATAIIFFNLSDEAGHRVDVALGTGRTPNGASSQDYQNQQMKLENHYGVAWLLTSAAGIVAFASAVTCTTARRSQNVTSGSSEDRLPARRSKKN